VYVKAEKLQELGVSKKTIESKVSRGEWEVKGLNTVNEDLEVEILFTSLPHELQSEWVKNNLPNDYSERVAALLSESSLRDLDEHAEEIKERLLHLTLEERQAWLAESLRMSRIVERYGAVEPKRQRHPMTGELNFVPSVYELCVEAACKDYLINPSC
jgi:hypothetical protein